MDFFFSCRCTLYVSTVYNILFFLVFWQIGNKENEHFLNSSIYALLGVFFAWSITADACQHSEKINEIFYSTFIGKRLIFAKNLMITNYRKQPEE